MRTLKRPVNGKRMPGLGSDVSQDCETLLVPPQSPRQDGGQKDDEESVRDVSNTGISWLQTPFQVPRVYLAPRSVDGGKR